jgi:hypothetical protein
VGVSAYGHIGVLVRPLPEQPAESSRRIQRDGRAGPRRNLRGSNLGSSLRTI